MAVDILDAVKNIHEELVFAKGKGHEKARIDIADLQALLDARYDEILEYEQRLKKSYHEYTKFMQQASETLEESKKHLFECPFCKAEIKISLKFVENEETDYDKYDELD